MLKKITPLVFKTKYWFAKVELQQATARESFEFIENIKNWDKDYLLSYVYDILQGANYTWKKEKIKKDLIENIDQTIEKVAQIQHKRHTSIYKWVDFDKVFDNKDINRSKKWLPPEVNNIYIAKELWVSVIDLHDKVTLEELWIYEDALLYSNLEKTEEGRRVNTHVRHNKTTQEEKERKIKELKKNKDTFKKAKDTWNYISTLSASI